MDYGTINDIPFLLEESLARKAARYNKVQPWQEWVIEDGRVITGQVLTLLGWLLLSNSRLKHFVP